MFSTIFCAVPAFMRVEPAIDLRAGFRRDRDLARAARSAIADSLSLPSSSRRGCAPAATRPARMASSPLAVMPTTTSRRRDAALRARSRAPCLASSSAPSDGVGQRAPSPGDHRLHQLRRNSERRRALRRVERRQPAARARSHVDQPAAARDARRSHPRRAQSRAIRCRTAAATVASSR